MAGKMWVESIEVFLVVLLAIFGGIAAIGKGIDTIRGWFLPLSTKHSTLTARLDRYEGYMNSDKLRIEALEQSRDEQQAINQMILEGQRQANRAIYALLKHARTGNDTGLMQETIDDMYQYLNDN